MATSPEGDALVELQQGPKKHQAAGTLQKGIKLDAGARYDSGSLSGYPAAFAAGAQQGKPVVVAAVVFNGTQYLIAGMARDKPAYERERSTLRAAINSFRAITPAERQAARPYVLKLVTTKPGMTMAKLARQSPLGADAESQLRLMNALYPSGEPKPGSPSKLFSKRLPFRSTRKEYAGGCPAAAQRPFRSSDCCCSARPGCCRAGGARAVEGRRRDHFVQLWLLLQSDLAPQAAASTPPLYYWVATATAWLTSPILALHDGARLASGLFIALALFFVARTARVLYGTEAGWAAALTLLGCVGLLVRGHELNAYTAQFAAAAIMLYGLAACRRALAAAGRWAWVATLMLLAGGAAEAVLILALAACCRYCLKIIVLRGASCAVCGGWARACRKRGNAGLSRHAGDPVCACAQPAALAGWRWPSSSLLPRHSGLVRLAGVAAGSLGLYRGRRQWRAPGMVLPLGALVGLLGLYALAAHPGEEQGLILLLPLALLGATGLFSLRRGAASALLWFAVMLFGFIGLVFWSTGARMTLAVRCGWRGGCRSWA